LLVQDYLLSILFGVIEGLTEFLPVSSTAHIRIGEALCGISLDDPYWKMYSILIQLGAIFSVVVYFRGRIAQFLRTFPKGKNGDRNIVTHPVSLVMIAFVVTALPTFVLKKAHVIDKNLESLWVIGTALMLGGVIMWGVDWMCRRPRTTEMERMGLGQAIWIGAAQILSAVFPGTSRSMSTIAAGQVGGMSREAALEFSFFLCIPTMFAATGYELLEAVRGKTTGGHLVITSHQWGVLLVGFIVSFVVALAVIAWFMHWVRKHG
jgi:undecaprenyl-diphosphatase